MLHRKLCIEICFNRNLLLYRGCLVFFLGKSVFFCVWNFTKKLITSDQLLKRRGLVESVVWLKHVETKFETTINTKRKFVKKSSFPCNSCPSKERRKEQKKIFFCVDLWFWFILFFCCYLFSSFFLKFVEIC